MNNAPPATLDKLNVVVFNILEVLLALGAIVLFFTIVTSAFKYLSSGGEPKAAEGAKNTFTYAIGGVVLLAFSFIILKIIGTITGTTSIIAVFDISR